MPYFRMVPAEVPHSGVIAQRVNVVFRRRNRGGTERVELSGVTTYPNWIDNSTMAIVRRAILSRVALPRHRTDTEATLRSVLRVLASETGHDWVCANTWQATRRRRPRRNVWGSNIRRSLRYPNLQSPYPPIAGLAAVDTPEASRPPYIHDHGYRPRVPQFLFGASEPHDSDTPFFGVELEIDDRAGRGMDANTVPALAHPLFYCKYDGSLHNGVELVSYPCSAKWWQEQYPNVTALLQNLAGRGWQSHSARTCGQHVHVSRTAFRNALHLYRFLHLVYRSPAFTLAISQRAANQLAQWATLDVRRRQALKVKAGLARDGYHDGWRYEAVNMTARTAEVRIFRGTLSPTRFMKNLEYLWAALAFTEAETNLRKCKAERFVGYVRERQADFSHLASFLAATPSTRSMWARGVATCV